VFFVGSASGCSPEAKNVGISEASFRIYLLTRTHWLIPKPRCAESSIECLIFKVLGPCLEDVDEHKIHNRVLCFLSWFLLCATTQSGPNTCKRFHGKSTSPLEFQGPWEFECPIGSPCGTPSMLWLRSTNTYIRLTIVRFQTGCLPFLPKVQFVLDCWSYSWIFE
jgi:hypothetical protein